MVRFRTTPLLLCAIGFSGLFLGCGLFFLSRHVTLPDQSTPRVGPLLIPSARPSHYVGSHACTACHAEIAAAYQSHSMAHSMSEIGDEIAIEDYSSETIIPDRERFYQIERKENFVTHHERMSDIDETILYDQSMPVRFVLGSGTRGRSYVIDHDGLLFQSPIGWYANGKRWDLSPGYRTNRTQRFERSIGDGCLYCHAGRVEHSDLIPKRYSSKVFLEAAIGCERCHGPGENHVHQMEILGEGETCLDSLIINPSDLEPSRREAVCNQCHLAGEGVIPKFGRGLFDFRPGDLLDDTVVVFVKDEKTRHDSGERAVSQVEQMRESRCYQASSHSMGCISCHDPHSRPQPDSIDLFYRNRCSTCHSENTCSLPDTKRDESPAKGSCIHCHMPRQSATDIPHTATTNHRIPRLPSTQPNSMPTATPSPLDYVPFDGAADRLSPRELDRARGIFLSTLSSMQADPRVAESAQSLLVPRGIDPSNPREVLDTLAGDVPSLVALASLFASNGQITAAVSCWQRALEFDPTNEECLSMLSSHMLRIGNISQATLLAENLVAANPSIASFHAQQAIVLGTSGKWTEGIAAALCALELDPTMLSLRLWLVGAYEKTAQTEKAHSQRDISNRMRAAASR